ncbi:MAG TPA: hypothetical protein ENI23_06915 [bacterium]|nr:hypothetical protein [bacterium]
MATLDEITRQYKAQGYRSNLDISRVGARPLNEPSTTDEVVQKPSFLEKTSGVLSSVFGGKKIGEAIGTQIAKATVPKEQKEFVSAGPTGKELAGDILATGASFAGLKGAGVVGGFGRRLLTNIGLGATISGGKALEEGADVSESLKPIALGGSIGAAIPVIGSGLRFFGRQIEQLPARFVNSALKRSKKDLLRDISKDKVDDFAKFVVESKPVGTAKTLANEASENVSKLGQQINSMLETALRKSGVKVTIGVDNFLDDIARLPEAQGALLNRADIKDIVTRLAPQTKQLLTKESLSLTEANKLRQLLDKTLGDRAFLGAQLSSDKTVLRGVANSLREQVKVKAPQEVRELFTELANEIRFRDGMLDRIAGGAGSQVLSFGDFIGGGLGGIFGGGLPGAVAGVTARRVLESVPFKIGTAKVVNAITKVEPILEQLTPVQQTAILNLFGEIFSDNEQDPPEITPTQ